MEPARRDTHDFPTRCEFSSANLTLPGDSDEALLMIETNIDDSVAAAIVGHRHGAGIRVGSAGLLFDEYAK
jgi:hypothetical protein